MKKLLLAVALTPMIGATAVLADSDLATSKKCFECHAVDKEVKGPSFRDIAKLHKGTENAEAKLADKIRKGGAEHWGPNVMPPADVRGVEISDAEAKKLAQWVLTH